MRSVHKGMTVGMYILKYIQLNATTQSEIATIAGTNASSFNEVIKGKRRLSGKLALQLEKRLKGFNAREVMYIQVEQELMS